MSSSSNDIVALLVNCLSWSSLETSLNCTRQTEMSPPHIVFERDKKCLKNETHNLTRIDLLTRKCPMKHMRRIIDRMRKATPKDIPKTAVLENTKCHNRAIW